MVVDLDSYVLDWVGGVSYLRLCLGTERLSTVGVSEDTGG